MKSGDPALFEVPAPGPAPAELGSLQSGRVIGDAARRIIYVPLVRWLSRPNADRWLVFVAMLAASASLFSGNAADDHIHHLSLRGAPGIAGFHRAFYDLFRFAWPDSNRLLMEDGVFPWWADPDTRLAFFRPLSSLTHALDHWLFADNALLAHVHSLLWFLLAVFGVRALYRLLFERTWVANLAFIFYALDDARGPPLTWLANRNAVVASSLSIWSLVCFVSWRVHKKRAGAWLAPVIFALALCAGEGAVSTAGYFAAYALFMDDGRWSRRLLRIAPYAVIVVLWRALTVALHYGSNGSGVYLDPAREPVAFLLALPERIIALLLGQLAGPWSELWNAATLLSPGIVQAFMAMGVAILCVVALLIRPLWSSEPRLRFCVVGALLSVIPACATFPADRLLAWVAIGASGALALIFERLIADSDAERAWPGPVLFAQLAALFIAAFHLLLGPLTLPWRSTGITAIRAMLTRANRSLPASPDIAGQTFVYVNPPADPFASYIPIMRADFGQMRPHTQRWLATGSADVELERIDVHTLRVVQAGGFLATPSEKMLRGPSNPFHVGDVVRLSGLTVRIARLTADRRPLEVLARFDVPLEDPSLRWFRWGEDRYRPFTPPRIGQTVTLPAIDCLKVAYGSD